MDPWRHQVFPKQKQHHLTDTGPRWLVTLHTMAGVQESPELAKVSILFGHTFCNIIQCHSWNLVLAFRECKAEKGSPRLISVSYSSTTNTCMIWYDIKHSIYYFHCIVVIFKLHAQYFIFVEGIWWHRGRFFTLQWRNVQLL